MAVTNPVKSRFNLPTLTTITDLFRLIRLGSVLRGQINQVLRNQVPAADAGSSASTMQTIVLPTDARASSISRAYARTGTAGTGALAIATAGATPSSGQIVVQPDGNLGVLAADALTNLDVSYIPERGFSMTFTGQSVVSNVWTIPAAMVARGVILLQDVNCTTATNTGRKRILAPSASTPATGACVLSVAKSTVTFAAGDAVTVADITLLLASENDLNTILESESDIF